MVDWSSSTNVPKKDAATALVCAKLPRMEAHVLRFAKGRLEKDYEAVSHPSTMEWHDVDDKHVIRGLDG